MRPRSLLERLRGEPEPEQKKVEPHRLPRPSESHHEPKHGEPQHHEYTLKQEQQEREAPLEASAFAGRRGQGAKDDVVQEMKLAVHRRIVDEMTPEEQAVLVRGEEAREQIKNIISVYSTREIAEGNYNLTRGERLQLVDDISNELLGLGPLEPLLQIVLRMR